MGEHQLIVLTYLLTYLLSKPGQMTYDKTEEIVPAASS